ncbi:alcohol dehydrogenase [Subtercola boreus]|uniref:Alcohol dehydrogenase n=2 Tax=Subtercola boreus TaxID=120213 RepID=A0A3E0VUM9_9MICO|nr:alcohol dehydrogenase [Subtercola boreus]
MMAIRAHRRGGPEVLTYESVPLPVPKAGEVLVQVHAAGITFAELSWDETWRSKDGQDRTPIIPAHEVSGVVSALGSGVNAFTVGDQVFGRVGFNRDGAAAEYVTVPATDLARRPLSVSHVESASIAMAALTAWEALVEHAQLVKGEHVVVLGGAGGVGSLAVQLAKHLGAHVSATAASDNLQFVSGLGADVVLDYASISASSASIQADIVIDAVGGPATAAAIRMVRPGGRFVTLSQPVDAGLLTNRDISATFFVVGPNSETLAEIARLVDAGAIRASVAQVLPLAQARSAFEEGPSVRIPGKTVLQVLPN